MKPINWDNVRTVWELALDGRPPQDRIIESGLSELAACARGQFCRPHNRALVLVMVDGEVMCQKCARDDYRLLYAATISQCGDPAWMVTGSTSAVMCHGERCSECGAEINPGV